MGKGYWQGDDLRWRRGILDGKGRGQEEIWGVGNTGREGIWEGR